MPDKPEEVTYAQDTFAQEQELLARRKADDLLMQRLSGIEAEIRAMRALVERLVRVEERLTTHLENDKRTEAALSAMATRVATLENANTSNTGFIKNAERLVWLCIAAAVAWFGHK